MFAFNSKKLLICDVDSKNIHIWFDHISISSCIFEVFQANMFEYTFVLLAIDKAIKFVR